METAVKRLYEGLFLVDTAIASADWEHVNDTIHRILARAEAEVVSFNKWDERKLTYDIGKVSRGTYILVYFNCDPLRVHEIERDVQLSETLLRAMILRGDQLAAEDIEKPTPAMLAEKQAEEAAQDAETDRQEAPADDVRAEAVDQDAPAESEVADAGSTEDADTQKEGTPEEDPQR